MRDFFDEPSTDSALVYHGIERPWRFEDHVRRDHNGRPYILAVDAEGNLNAAQTTYTRVTTFIKGIDDGYHLDRWRLRQLAKGFALSPSVYAAQVAVHAGSDEEKPRLDALCEEMIDRAGANDAAAIGTALHALTERHDLGMATPVMPDIYAADLARWVELTAPFVWYAIERFMVNDILRTGGTPDRIAVLKQPCPTCSGTLRIVDLKSGRVDGFTYLTTCMQLAAYSVSDLYDHETGTRTPIPQMCRCRAYVIHIPAGSGKGNLLDFPLDDGLRLLHELMPQIRTARTVKPQPVVVDPLTLRIDWAVDRAELEAVWASANGSWTAQHTEAARRRFATFDAPRATVAG